MVKSTVSQFILALIGIFLLGSLPYLLFDIEVMLKIKDLLDSGRLKDTSFLYQTISLRTVDYLEAITSTINGIIHPSEWVYIDSRNIVKPLFPNFQGLYITTLKYLSLALLLSFVLSMIFTYTIMLLNNKVKAGVKFFFFVIESLPDLFVIISLQLFVIWFYKKTNILLFNFSSSYGTEAILLPLIILSFLPTIYMTRYLLVTYEGEFQSQYVELAKGKGLTVSEILIIHIFRNAFASFIYHFKTIFWFTLSNLLIVEIVLNNNGMLKFVWQNCARNPELLTLCMLLIFLPFFFVMSILKSLVKKTTLLQDV